MLEPVMAANTALPITVAMANPPRTLRTNTLAAANNSSLKPFPKTAPIKTNKGITPNS